MITNDSIKKSRLSAALSLLDESGLVNGKDEISPALVKNILNIRYGLEGELRRLPTEKDDSFILTCDGGHRLVKISSSGESRGVVEMQSAVMEWLNNHTSAWEVQNVITTLDGESIVPIQTKSVRYLRVLTYISGDIMATVPVDEEQLILTGALPVRLIWHCGDLLINMICILWYGILQMFQRWQFCRKN